MIAKRTPLRLYPDPSRVILLYLDLHKDSRVRRMVSKVNTLTEEEVTTVLGDVMAEFENRHPSTNQSSKGQPHKPSVFRQTIAENYKKIQEVSNPGIEPGTSLNRQLLIGAYVTKEYSLESAALFNPSMVPHPDQSNLDQGATRFVMSLRATGEGHISSIEFRTGVVDSAGSINLDKNTPFTVTPLKVEANFTKQFITDRVESIPEFNLATLDTLPDAVGEKELKSLIKKMDSESMESMALTELEDSNYDIKFEHDGPLSEKAIFPSARCESMGMEDVRFVKFEDGDESCYYGTYTAYNGTNIISQLIETSDFNELSVRSLYGKAINDKGMALFPRKINGKYAMVSRQGGENISIMLSENIHFWDDAETLEIRVEHWNLIQTGNCGSPIETPQGWLLLTHAVGALRKYVISACLLELDDPTRVLGSLKEPLLSPNAEEREGYVPNVVYSCGGMLSHDELILPYAMSDSSIGIAVVSMSKLIKRLLESQTHLDESDNEVSNAE